MRRPKPSSRPLLLLLVAVLAVSLIIVAALIQHASAIHRASDIDAAAAHEPLLEDGKVPLHTLVADGSTGFGFAFDNALFIVGMRITAEARATYIDVFGLPRSKVYAQLVCKPGQCQQWSRLLPWPAASAFLQTCEWNGHVGFFVSVPVLSTDANRANFLHVWRCALAPDASAVLVKADGPLIDVVIRGGSGGAALKFAVPAHAQALGFGGPLHPSPRLGAFPRGKLMTLCVGGIQANAIPLVRHFVRHHLLVGVNSLVLGVYFKEGSGPHKRLAAALGERLLDGTVTLMFLARLLRVVPPVDALEYFHTTCLYHAKAVRSVHVGCWDVRLPRTLLLGSPLVFLTLEPHRLTNGGFRRRRRRRRRHLGRRHRAPATPRCRS